MAGENDGHEQINFDNIHNLTIKDGELYWRKKKLQSVTVKHFALSIWQGIIALAIAAATIIAPFVNYLANLENICKVTNQKSPFCPIRQTAKLQPEEKTTEKVGDGGKVKDSQIAISPSTKVTRGVESEQQPEKEVQQPLAPGK